ncbi:MAG: exo-alpha-sialidase [Chloroflexi bacterium]|nr:exo-alpha-sialidase [Chloroflexota bacterium]MBM3174591.1 exo-alpha-sialidase [Chloroflexota bacterium]MBM4449351.1 exo-alpha-sialidase [Chloroflexota bacterium]
MTRFYGITLTLVCLACLLAFPALSATVSASPPGSAVLKWAIIDTPASTPEKNDILSPSEINAITVSPDGNTLYAIDIPNASSGPVVIPGIWKSTDGGYSWSPKSTQYLVTAMPQPRFPVMDITVAPDDSNLVAVVCLNAPGTLRREIYLSTDGGTTWYYAGAIPWVYGGGEQVGDIVLSPGYELAGKPVHDIIVCSRNPADGNGQGEVYVLTYPGLGGWKTQDFGKGDVIAIACSPNYTTDFSLVAMASTTQRTYIHLGYRDVAANTSRWNMDANWPVEMCTPDQSGSSGSGENQLITGDIDLPGDFLGTSREKRVIFASYDSDGKAQGTSQVLDDAYRLNDTLITRMKMPGCGSNARISTIAYHGDSKKGKLLAGEVGATASEAAGRVWICHNPLESCPIWSLSLKPPTGGGNHGYANAQIAWVSDGSAAFGGTGSGNRNTPQKWANPHDVSWNGQSLDESAVSITRDDGISWNQIGLIDTVVNWLKSVFPAYDESTLYLATVNDAGFDSVWRSQSPFLGQPWERVLCVMGESPILRLAPETKDGATVFWGNQGTDMVRHSTDSGQIWYNCMPGFIIQDMVAADSQTLLVLQADGQVRRGSYSKSWTWEDGVDSGLISAHTIAIHGDYVLVGAATSSVSPIAFSADGGQSWTKITEQTPSNGNRHVAFDTYFNRNRIIYVADDSGGMYRWAIGTSYEWDDLAPPNNSFYGMALGGGGALYGTFFTAASGVDRTLYPRSGIPKPGMYWDSLTTGLTADVRFTTEPDALAISQTTLWAIDARAYSPPAQGRLWAFTDTLARSSPKLNEPAEGVTLNYDPVSGRNQEIDLKWEQLSLASAYEIELARDEDFSLRITEAEPANNPYYQPSLTTQPTYRIIPGMLPEVNTTYYCRIRVREAATGQRIRSWWSDERSFSVGPGVPVAASQVGVQALRPVHCSRSVSVSSAAFSWTPFKGVTEYRFVLAEDSALIRVLVDEVVAGTAFEYRGRLDYGKSYFWQVTSLRPYPSQPSSVFSFNTETLPKPVHPEQQMSNQLLQIVLAMFLLNVLGNVTVIAVMVLVNRRRETGS